MAGRPKRRAMIAELERRARGLRDEWDEDREPTILDYVCVFVASGGTIAELARQINVKREVLSEYIHRSFPDAGQRLTEARRKSAYAFAEEAHEVAKETPVDKMDAAAKRLQIQTKQWLAERFNRDELGAQRGPQVAILTVGDLHLTALENSTERGSALPASARASLQSGPNESEPEYEVLPNGATSR